MSKVLIVAIPYEGEVFLLNRRYREDQYKEYVNGVPLIYVLKKTRLSQKQKLRDHIIRNLKYIEKEYEICIFKKTMKKENKKKCISYKQQNIDYEIA